jgi:DNA-repair protein XRCC3
MNSDSREYRNLDDKRCEQAIASLKSVFSIATELDIVHLSRVDIQRVTKFSDNELTAFLVHVSLPLCANIATSAALELHQQRVGTSKLSLGCPILDSYLNGGIPQRGITEIVGQSSCGKTQLCLQLCLQVQLPCSRGGLGGTACYIHTESGEFPLKRLQQLTAHFEASNSFLVQQQQQQQQQQQDANPSGDSSLNALLNGIYTKRVNSLGELNELLAGNSNPANSLPHLLQQKNVKLVVIDSIAALFRWEDFNSNDPTSPTVPTATGNTSSSSDHIIGRSKILWQQASQLKLLSDSFGVPIVVVNQVSDYFQSTATSSYGLRSNKLVPQVIPALGSRGLIVLMFDSC